MRTEKEKLQIFVDNFLKNRNKIKVLEAGCGSMSYLNLNSGVYMVGIDVSERQLNNNSYLQEKILGDIQTYELPKSEYDIIICWDVLEHLSTPSKALLNFQKGIKENGLIILAFPNFFSIKSLITRITPYVFHRWVYKIVFGLEKFGGAGYEPFPTFLKIHMSPEKIKSFAFNNGLSVDYFSIFESGFQRKTREKIGLINSKWKFFVKVVKLFSFGMVRADASDCLMVLRKKPVIVQYEK